MLGVPELVVPEALTALPRATEALDALAVGLALRVVVGEAVQRQAAERYLERAVAAPKDPEAPVHARAVLELGGGRDGTVSGGQNLRHSLLLHRRWLAVSGLSA